MNHDPHADLWVALAKAAERINRSENCSSEHATAFCQSIDRLSAALQGEILREPTTPRPPDYWGFVNVNENQIDLCFSPDGPNEKGRFAIPLWSFAQPLKEDEDAVKLHQSRIRDHEPK